jgi:hypothetical protein
VNKLPGDLKIREKGAWNENLFKINESALPLDKEIMKNVNTYVMRGVFLSKRGRQGIKSGIMFLWVKLKCPTNNDWICSKLLYEFIQIVNYDLTITFYY